MNSMIPTEQEKRAYFLRVEERLEKAAGGTETEIVRIQVAHCLIELRFICPRLRQLIMPALEHLVVEAGDNPEFSVGLWSTSSTGVGMLPPPGTGNRFSQRGDLWGFTGESVRLAFLYGEYSVSLFDQKSGRGIYWVKDPSVYPYWAVASPLRPILHWCAESRNEQFLHAAAVGTDNGAVLLTGKGGIGKSTTALDCLLRGMYYVGDDYLVVSPDGEPQAHRLYASAKVDTDARHRFPELEALLYNKAPGKDEKYVYMLHPEYKNRIPPFLPVKAILLPRITGDNRSTIEGPVSPDIVSHEASFTTVAQLPHAGGKTYDRLRVLAGNTPGYRLNLGKDRDQLAELLTDISEGGVGKAAGGWKTSSSDDRSLPMVSVVIPVYNRRDFIVEAVESVISQEYPFLELIIVDDGSTDGTAEVVRALGSDIRYYHQPNQGPAAARNVGILNATGDLIAFLDSDDLLPPGSLHVLVNSLTEDPEAFVARGYSQVTVLNRGTGKWDCEGSPTETFPNSIPGSVFRPEAFRECGLFDEGLLFGEDADWFNRAEEEGLKIVRPHCISLIVRRHGRNMTHGKNTLELNTLRVFKKALERKRDAEAVPAPDKRGQAI